MKFTTNPGQALCLSCLLLLLPVVLLLGGLSEGSVASTLFIGEAMFVCGVALLTLERRDSSLPVLLQWFVVAYSLRVGFTIFIHVTATTVQGSPFLCGDESEFYQAAQPLLTAWHNGTILRQSPEWYQLGYWAWLHIIGLVRFTGETLGGDTVLNVKFVSCGAGALIVPYVYALAGTIFDKKTARVAAGLALLLPDYWLFSATLLRDVLVSCVILIVFYQVLMCVYCRFRWWRVAVALLLNFGLLLFLRSSVSFLLVGMVVCCVLWDWAHRSRAHRLLFFSATCVLAAGFVLGLVVLAGRAAPYQKFLNVVQTHGVLSRAMDRYTDKAVQEASDDSLGVLFVKLPVCLRVPISAFRLLFLPIPPWGPLQTQTYFNLTRALLETVAGCAWYALLPFLTVGVVATLRYRKPPTAWIWIPAFVFVLALAVNTGLTARWRLMPMPFLLVLVAQGWVLRAQYRQLVGLVILLVVALLASYILIKYLWPTLGVLSLATGLAPAFVICLADALRRRNESRGPLGSCISGTS